MSEVTKIADLCYTASFMFDRLADISIQVHDLEKETIKSSVTVEDIEKNVIQFNKELDDVPRMRPSARSYVPRRSTFTRPLDTYRVNNSPYTHYQMSSSYRLVSNSAISGKTFNLRNDQMAASSNSSILYRKRQNNDEGPVESKQIKGIKWVSATEKDVQNSGLNIGNIANLAKTSNSIGNFAPRQQLTSTHPSTFSVNYSNYNGPASNNGRIIKSEPLSPMRNNRPLNSINALNKPSRKVTEEDMAVNALLHSFSNENVDSDGTEF